MNRTYLQTVVWLNRRAKSASLRLTRLTGKSKVRIHPKHLVTVEANQHWYLDYIKPGLRVLDVGCGNGVHSLRVAGQGGVVVGIDSHPGHLRTGHDLSTERGVTTSFVRGDLEKALPLQTGQFDVVLLLDVIEHLYGRVEVLREIHRVLRPGGTLLVAAPNRDTRWKRRLHAAGLSYFSDPDHKVEYSWAELRAELGAGGFEPTGEPKPIVYDTPWAGLIDLVGGVSLRLYRRLGQWKWRMAHRYPDDTIGWHVACVRLEDASALV